MRRSPDEPPPPAPRPTPGQDVVSELLRQTQRRPEVAALAHNAIVSLVALYGQLLESERNEKEQLRIENARLRATPPAGTRVPVSPKTP
jgi:hypothetical protein